MPARAATSKAAARSANAPIRINVGVAAEVGRRRQPAWHPETRIDRREAVGGIEPEGQSGDAPESQRDGHDQAGCPSAASEQDPSIALHGSLKVRGTRPFAPPAGADTATSGNDCVGRHHGSRSALVAEFLSLAAIPVGGGADVLHMDVALL